MSALPMCRRRDAMCLSRGSSVYSVRADLARTTLPRALSLADSARAEHVRAHPSGSPLSNPHCRGKRQAELCQAWTGLSAHRDAVASARYGRAKTLFEGAYDLRFASIVVFETWVEYAEEGLWTGDVY